MQIGRERRSCSRLANNLKVLPPSGDTSQILVSYMCHYFNGTTVHVSRCFFLGFFLRLKRLHKDSTAVSRNFRTNVVGSWRVGSVGW